MYLFERSDNQLSEEQLSYFTLDELRSLISNLLKQTLEYKKVSVAKIISVSDNDFKRKLISEFIAIRNSLEQFAIILVHQLTGPQIDDPCSQQILVVKRPLLSDTSFELYFYNVAANQSTQPIENAFTTIFPRAVPDIKLISRNDKNGADVLRDCLRVHFGIEMSKAVLDQQLADVQTKEFKVIHTPMHFKEILSAAGRNIISRLIVSGGTFAFMYFYDHHDASTINAGLIVITTQRLIGSLGATPYSGLQATIASQATSDPSAIGSTIHAGWLQALVLGGVCTALAAGMEPILLALKQSQNIAETTADTYSPYIYCLGLFSYAQLYADVTILISLKHDKIYLIANGISTVISIGLASILIDGSFFRIWKFSDSGMGAKGYAVAHSIQTGLAFLITRAYLLRQPEFRHQYRVLQWQGSKVWRTFLKIFLQGIWAFLSKSSDIIAIFAIALFSTKISTQTALIENIMETYRLLLMRTGPAAITQALQTRIGNGYGQLALLKNGEIELSPQLQNNIYQNIFRNIAAALILSIIYSGLCNILFQSTPYSLAYFIAGDSSKDQIEKYPQLRLVFVLVGIGGFLEGCKLLFGAMANAYKYFFIPMVISFITNIGIVIFVAYSLGISQNQGVPGLEAAAIMGFAYSIAFMIAFDFKIHRDTKQEVNKPRIERLNHYYQTLFSAANSSKESWFAKFKTAVSFPKISFSKHAADETQPLLVNNRS